ncbi:unnamed protein product [Ceutorhynchus assimilis]|uniref:Cytochrome b5 heme-binding domain-containing protein n=1 Tax=Ceutorhynchus assimilis TaxID=467358 RepID=A0A9N9QE59_9CUCU|nr:unnamed protein product [Ceutorhynchus assimilis]
MLKPLFLLGLLGLILSFYLSDIYYSFQRILNLNSNKQGPNYLFTSEELATFDGTNGMFLYLSIMGQVYNVTDGLKHYGVGEPYHFFVGKDATRHFITGDFENEYSRDDVDDLDQNQLRSLNNWLKFYKSTYKRVGKLMGRYFDEFGRLTPYAREIKKLIKEAEKSEESNQTDKRKFPPCNIEWDAVKGSRVWCTNKSGGIERTWAGKPRQYYEAGSKSFRCACISEENKGLGTIKEYSGCDSDSDSCFIKT